MPSIDLDPAVGKAFWSSGRLLIIAAVLLPATILTYMYAPIPENHFFMDVLRTFFWLNGIVLPPMLIWTGIGMRKIGAQISPRK